MPNGDYVQITIDMKLTNAYFLRVCPQLARRGERMAIRQQVISALDYPKSMVLDISEERNCPGQQGFDPNSDHCRECTINGECHWVTWLDDCRDLEDKPTHTLVASLRYGVKLIKSLQSALPHDEAGCACEECTWIRACEDFIAEFDSARPANPHRPVN
jgi:hypothetical protein